MTAGVFITGTDTSVGKTTLACRLVQALETNGVRVAVRKPVESGCRKSRDGLIAEDAECLAKASVARPSSRQVCRYRYRATTSPARAAMLAGAVLRIEQLVACCRCDDYFTVVEGAGGLCSPIAADGLNIDLIVALGFPVVVVSPDRLGSINHILLNLEALATRHLNVAAVVLNRIHPQHNATELDNYSELSQLISTPIIQMHKENIPAEALSMLLTSITKSEHIT